MLSSVPKHKKTVMCLIKKVYVLDKLHSGMSYGVAGHEFNANKSIIYIKYVVKLNRNTHKIRLC